MPDLRLVAGLIFATLVACNDISDTEAIDLKVASPTDVAVSQDGGYFYVLNADFDGNHESGSILVIDETGAKKNAITVPRLGRDLTLAGTDLLALFDKADDDAEYEVHLYDVSTPEQPKLKKKWSGDALDCLPLSAALYENYQHFAISCAFGRLFIGTLASPREQSTLKLVRDYDKTRRAIHIDTNRELLFAFVTDIGRQNTSDNLAEDKKTYHPETGVESDGANQIPDEYESSKSRRRNSTGARRRYQMVVYNIAAERSPADTDESFPFRNVDDQSDLTAQNELRWLYFTLKDFDGTPDSDAQITNFDVKHYRTNFWQAHADPFDANSFYLSHRGRQNDDDSKHTNNIVRVSIKGDISQTDPIANTSEVLDFERIYGFKGELDKDRHFPGDFSVNMISGRLTLLINHFRDMVNFRSNPSFSVAAKLLDGGFWRKEVRSSEKSNSYFQVAVNARGKALSCAFYGNAVIPLEVQPGTDIKVGWGDLTRID